jgi:alpha-L-rhamnosidase
VNAITPKDFPEIRWHGHWIWAEKPAEPSSPFGAALNLTRPEAHGFFRKTFSLDRIPERVPARITADSRYILYVNGQEAFRGPVRSQPRRMAYDLLDLAPYLKPGENLIAVYVKYYGSPKSFWMPAVPNMMLGRTGVMVFEANLGSTGWLVSDPTWKTIQCEAWFEIPGAEANIAAGLPAELFDARKFPYGWQAPGFDDSAWDGAYKIPAMHIGGYARTQPPTDPYGPLYPRTIARLNGEVKKPVNCQYALLQGLPEDTPAWPAKRMVDTLKQPVLQTVTDEKLPLTLDIPAGCTARMVLDFSVIVSGFAGFEIEAPAGTILELAYLEDPLKPARGPFGAHGGTRYIARGTDDRFQVFDSNGFRYVYLLVHNLAGPFTLKDFWLQENVYPWQGEAGFSCDDEVLNRIFTAGIRTVQLNSHDAFLDCPTREQRAWVGDSVVHQMVHLATNQDWRLAWHYLELSNSPRSDGILPMSVAGDIEVGGGQTIPDWALNWVHGVYNRYRFSGDKDAVKALMPSVERVLRWYLPYQTSAGVLKDVVEWNLVDWSSVSNEDTSAILSAIWGRGLMEFAEMAAWLEEKSSQRWAEGVYQKIKDGFEMFWDESRGSYIDHIKNGVKQPEMSQLAGALAILARLAPQDRWQRIIDRITDPKRVVVRSWTGAGGDYSPEKMRKQFMGIYEPDWDTENEVVSAEPFMSYTVHDAVAMAGMADRLPELYQRWAEFLVDGYDTIGECWGWGTHVHGWSCTPTKDMVFYTLGVTPAEPGYTKARIAPRLGKLKWAKGKVPTPHGFIQVEVRSGSLRIDSPVPVEVDLSRSEVQSLPAGRHEVGF